MRKLTAWVSLPLSTISPVCTNVVSPPIQLEFESINPAIVKTFNA